MYRIVRREEMDDGILILNEIEAPAIASKAKPGQFVVLNADEKAEMIQLPLTHIDRQKGTVTVTYMVISPSTASFGDLRVGETYRNVIGPFSQSSFR